MAMHLDSRCVVVWCCCCCCACRQGLYSELTSRPNSVLASIVSKFEATTTAAADSAAMLANITAGGDGDVAPVDVAGVTVSVGAGVGAGANAGAGVTVAAADESKAGDRATVLSATVTTPMASSTGVKPSLALAEVRGLVTPPPKRKGTAVCDGWPPQRGCAEDWPLFTCGEWMRLLAVENCVLWFCCRWVCQPLQPSPLRKAIGVGKQIAVEKREEGVVSAAVFKVRVTADNACVSPCGVVSVKRDCAEWPVFDTDSRVHCLCPLLPLVLQRSTGPLSLCRGGFQYYGDAAGGCCVVLLIGCMFAVSSGAQTLTNWWLSYWSDNFEEHSGLWFLGIYALLTVLALVVQIVLRLVFATASVKAVRRIHEVWARHCFPLYLQPCYRTDLGIADVDVDAVGVYVVHVCLCVDAYPCGNVW